MADFVYVAVDETGNLGKSLKGERFYTLVACVVSDRTRFENATKKLGFDEEVKFNTHAIYRERVLRAAAPAISDVFYVRYQKDKALNRFGQSGIHLKMVQSLADSVILRYGYLNDLVVEIDHKDGISDSRVSNLFSGNEYRVRHIQSDVVDSADSYGLQTNDFVVGAIGAMLNHSDFSYVRLLKHEPRRSYIRSENVKSRTNEKQGEHASVKMRTTCHTDSSVRNSPPGIATGLTCYLRADDLRPATPVVRLRVISASEYKNGSEEGGCY